MVTATVLGLSLTAVGSRAHIYLQERVPPGGPQPQILLGRAPGEPCRPPVGARGPGQAAGALGEAAEGRRSTWGVGPVRGPVPAPPVGPGDKDSLGPGAALRGPAVPAWPGGGSS